MVQTPYFVANQPVLYGFEPSWYKTGGLDSKLPLLHKPCDPVGPTDPPNPKTIKLKSQKNRGPIWLDDRGTGQWKWLEEVPGRTLLAPLASPCFVLCLIRVEREGLLDYQGRAGIISIVWWNLRPVIFGVEKSDSKVTFGGVTFESLSGFVWGDPQKPLLSP